MTFAGHPGLAEFGETIFAEMSALAVATNSINLGQGFPDTDGPQEVLDAAAADGIRLGGWGYRDHSTQIRLRRAHCGTSNWAIYHQRSSTCRPPTARPGQSQHELGKAIDFTYNGRTIGSRSSPAFMWLRANAGRYGFYNLPSEPWHWSTTGG